MFRSLQSCIISSYNAIIHNLYADDSQLYVSFALGDSAAALNGLQSVQSWMLTNKLKLNPDNNNSNNSIYNAPCICVTITGANNYYYPWSIGLEIVIPYTITAPLRSLHPLLPIWRWWSYSTIQYPSLADQVAHVGKVACLRPQETAVSWAWTPAIRVTVEHKTKFFLFVNERQWSK